MKLQALLLAMLLAFVGTTATADFSSDDGWTGWDGFDDTNWGWDRDQEWGDRDFCPGDGTPPPNVVPSPTAALAGLGVMGLMLTRRRRRD